VTPAALAAADCVVVATDHPAFPWADVAQHARIVVDGRGAVPRALVRGTYVPLSGPSVRPAARTPAEERRTPEPRG
jgi:hypothetical protein